MVAVISATLFALVLWQIVRLDAFVGLDPSAVGQYRLGLSTRSDVMATIEAVAQYRRVAVLGGSPMQVTALRDVVEARMRALNVLFSGNGVASGLNAGGDWQATRSSWQRLRAKPDTDVTLADFRDVTRQLGNMLNDCLNLSRINYDPNSASQILAGDLFVSVPFTYEAVERTLVSSLVAKRTGQMSLKDRLALVTSLQSIQTNQDLSSAGSYQDALRDLAVLDRGNAAQYATLVGTGDRFMRAATAYYKLLNNGVLYEDHPTFNAQELIARASDSSEASHRLGFELTNVLTTSLDRRAEIFNQRRVLMYIAFLLGACCVVGLMLVMAQVAAFRSGQALKRAREESDRLSAELARQKAEEALRLSEAQFKAVFEGAAIGIAVLDRGGAVVDANGVFRTLFGDSITAALDGHELELSELLAGDRDTFEYEQHLRTALGQEVWTDATVSVVNEQDGKPLFAICMFRDKTALKHNERRMLHDKTHDSLTGLPNRWLFEEHLRRRFEEATALLDSFFAVLFIDLEHFRDINESLGHSAGDSVLTQVAQRLRSSVDARDVVARLGSDEFAILLQSLGDILHVESVSRRVINNLSKVINISGRTIYLGASVGIAIGSSSYERAEDVMRDAEIAMQHSKIGGGARYAMFDSKMHDRAQKRLQLTTDIRQALERSEFRLLYQPIVNIDDGTPVGCEALLRWDHPSEGVMSPTEFMPIAEQNGLATPIGRFVVNTACEQLSLWRRHRNGRMDFNLHVNVSAAELDDVDFERALVQAIEHHGLSPDDLTIEITESVVLDSGTRANVTLERIRDRGFRICIDDFGTGYSSLRYLQQFKVDAIKIDRGFVAGADGELASEPIVRTLMTLAEAFDVRVVAEGVETVRQREVLRDAGCRLAQGFLYARPISAAEMVTLYPEVLGRLSRSASA
jgi:diguanylate cyclase (GGDEF)-like protein/PAS domain S-box-containing protein